MQLRRKETTERAVRWTQEPGMHVLHELAIAAGEEMSLSLSFSFSFSFSLFFFFFFVIHHLKS